MTADPSCRVSSPKLPVTVIEKANAELLLTADVRSPVRVRRYAALESSLMATRPTTAMRQQRRHSSPERTCP